MWKAIPIIISIVVILTTVAVIIPWVAGTLFNRMVTKEVKELLANAKGTTEVVTKADLAGLPPSVQKWLEHSQVIGKEKIKTVRLKQKGLMRLKEGAPWMPAEAEQYFTVDEPGFIWQAKIKMAPLIYFTGRDKYYGGHGNMLIKALSIYPVADAAGKEIDQGTLLRYLAEIQWFPTAALSDYITWEEIDAKTAKATISYKGITASGIFFFDNNGDLVKFTAKRFRDADGKFELTGWGGNAEEYREFNGIRIPNRGQVFWELDTGDFNWYKWEITDIEYNNPYTRN